MNDPFNPTQNETPATMAPQNSNPAEDAPQFAADGNPWRSEKDALVGLKKSNLNPDNYTVIEYEGGWAIVTNRKAVSILKERRAAAAAQPINAKPMKFIEVAVAPPGANDSPTFPVLVNGQAFTCRRGMRMILPEPHVLVLEQATEEDIRPAEQGSPQGIAMQVGATLVARYSISRIREVDVGEFEAFMKRMNEEKDKALVSQKLQAS